jgi:transcriptional regulator with XRE-family HTH domain
MKRQPLTSPPAPQQVRAVRAWFGLSQDQFAQMAGLPKRTLARFELGEGLHHDSTLMKINTAIEKLSVDLLFAGERPIGIRINDSLPKPESEA